MLSNVVELECLSETKRYTLRVTELDCWSTDNEGNEGENDGIHQRAEVKLIWYAHVRRNGKARSS